MHKGFGGMKVWMRKSAEDVQSKGTNLYLSRVLSKKGVPEYCNW